MKEMMSLVKDKTNTLTNQTNSTMMRRKRREKNGIRNFLTHQSANTAERITHPRQNMHAGNWTRM
jgi:hypothetical protein